MADKEIKSILMVKLSSIGDVVHSLPVLKALRARYPKAHIAWVVKPFCREIVEGNPHLDEILVFQRDQGGDLKKVGTVLREFGRLIRDIRGRKFDMVVDLQGLFYTGVITFLSGSPIRMGFANARECAHLFYNRKVCVPTMNLHAVDRYWLMAKDLGLPKGPKDFEISSSSADRDFVRGALARHTEGRQDSRGPVIALNPAARWVTKQWNMEKFAELGDALYAQWRAHLVFIGSQEDVPLVQAVRKAMRAPAQVLTGKTSLKQLVALLKEADLLITNDTGPMHIASSVNTPTVAMFGPTDPRRTGPYGPGHVVARKDVYCGPCLRKRCSNGLLCMEILTVNDVLAAVTRGVADGEFARADAAKAARLAQAGTLQELPRRGSVDITILSDRKAGHLNQTLGMVRRIPNIRYRVVDIVFRSMRHRMLAWFAALLRVGGVNLLRHVLIPESFADLFQSAPRVVLSAGNSVAPVNLLTGKVLQAKTAVSMKPGALPFERFDLAVVPMHDAPPKRSHVLETLGAPNCIAPGLLRTEALRLGSTLALKKKLHIGVLLGGETRDYYIARETGIALTGEIKRLCQELDADFLLSTSRRTPRAIERMIAGAFRDDPSCVLMSLASAEANNPVPGMLGLCDIIVVTEESTSMVSEAASSGKAVAVIRIDRRRRKRLKQEKMIQELAGQGYVRATAPDRLYETVMDMWPAKTPPKVLGDTEVAAQALENLLGSSGPAPKPALQESELASAV